MCKSDTSALKIMWGRLEHSILLIAIVRASSSRNANIVDVWERSKEFSKQEDWNRDMRECKIKEVCPEHSKNCEDKVKWKKVGKKLKSPAEVIVHDDRTMYQATFNQILIQEDLDKLKDHLCDMTLIRRNVKKRLFDIVDTESVSMGTLHRGSLAFQQGLRCENH